MRTRFFLSEKHFKILNAALAEKYRNYFELMTASLAFVQGTEKDNDSIKFMKAIDRAGKDRDLDLHDLREDSMFGR